MTLLAAEGRAHGVQALGFEIRDQRSGIRVSEKEEAFGCIFVISGKPSWLPVRFQTEITERERTRKKRKPVSQSIIVLRLDALIVTVGL